MIAVRQGERVNLTLPTLRTVSATTSLVLEGNSARKFDYMASWVDGTTPHIVLVASSMLRRNSPVSIEVIGLAVDPPGVRGEEPVIVSCDAAKGPLPSTPLTKICSTGAAGNIKCCAHVLCLTRAH